MDKLALRPEEAAKALGLSRGATYAALKSGALPSQRLGRRILVPISSLEAWLGDRTEQSDSIRKREAA